MESGEGESSRGRGEIGMEKLMAVKEYYSVPYFSAFNYPSLLFEKKNWDAVVVLERKKKPKSAFLPANLKNKFGYKGKESRIRQVS